MVQRTSNVGGFISVIPHQGDRSRIRDLSSAYGVPFDCGNSSESWAAISCYATQHLGVSAIGIGSDFNGFAEWSHRASVPTRATAITTRPTLPAPRLVTPVRCSITTAIRCRSFSFGSRTWDYNVDGLAHVGLYPDFIADLQTQGLGDKLGPLFNSTEAYVKMWEKIDDVDPPMVQCGTVGGDWHAIDVSVPCNAYDTGGACRSGRCELRALDRRRVRVRDRQRLHRHALADLRRRRPLHGGDPGVGESRSTRKLPPSPSPHPLPGHRVEQGGVPSANSCSDGDAGVAQCHGPIGGGSALDTSVGSHPFTVHAVDGVGNTVEVAHPYDVAFGVCLLFDPSKVKNAGSTVPVKLQLCDAQRERLRLVHRPSGDRGRSHLLDARPCLTILATRIPTTSSGTTRRWRDISSTCRRRDFSAAPTR